MLLQVVLASVQAQYIVGELGDDERSPLGALQGDDDICLMARQAYRPGQRQQVQMQMRVTMAELTQLPGHQHGAIALGNADTHLPGQAVTRAGQGLLDTHAGPLHQLDLGQQAAPGFCQGIATGITDE